jgi:hypothetical protein
MLSPEVPDLRGVGADDEPSPNIADNGHQVRHTSHSFWTNDDAVRRRPEASPSARHSGPAAYGERSHSLLQQLDILPASEMRSLYGSITRSAVISLPYVCLVMVSPPVELLGCREFRFIVSQFLNAARSMLTAKRGEARINDSHSCRGFLVALHVRPSRCVTGEDKVANFGGLVARKAGVVHRLVGGFAVVKLSEPPATGRGVFS